MVGYKGALPLCSLPRVPLKWAKSPEAGRPQPLSGAEMGSKGGLAGRPGTGVPEQSKGGSDSSFLPAIWGMDASGVFVRDACGVGLRRRIRGRLGGTRREHGVPSSGPSFGAREQGGSLPSPSLVSWLLRCHSGLDVPAQLREAPSPPSVPKLSPASGDPAPPPPRVPVWGDRLGAGAPR